MTLGDGDSVGEGGGGGGGGGGVASGGSPGGVGSPGGGADDAKPKGFLLAKLASGPSKDAPKIEHLLMCKGARGSVWLSLEADAVRLQSSEGGMGGAAAWDWKVSLRAPFKVENRLPCECEFFVWEKPKPVVRSGKGVGSSVLGGSVSSSMSGGGAMSLSLISRQHGVIKSGDVVPVHSIDIRCPVLITWLPQGGWKSDKV